MSRIECILFDCMETLVDIKEAPELKEYDAIWAFEGSGNEGYWKDFDEFLRDYKTAKCFLEDKCPNYKEYEMSERYHHLLKDKIGEEHGDFEEAITNFAKIYWENYSSRCYVRDEVKAVLERLSKRYTLGIVSNFKVSGGVEDLLEKTGISHFFKTVTVSVNVGWRKPNPNIYNIASDSLGLKSSEIIFVGDDFKCDYEGPRNIGIKSILLDRSDKFSHIEDRVRDFYELEKVL
ncbi:MAG: HAD family hydrolase [Bacillota bacterium]|nr:HAD family hydrolase [Bacillota bacterium]